MKIRDFFCSTFEAVIPITSTGSGQLSLERISNRQVRHNLIDHKFMIRILPAFRSGNFEVDELQPEVSTDDKEIEIMIISSKDKSKDDDQNTAGQRNIKQLNSIDAAAKQDAYDQ